jgi:hypothetical protein
MSFDYSKKQGEAEIMDERKKTIKELEDKKRENQESVNLMLADLGETLLGRTGGEGAEENRQAEAAEYRRLLKEIAAAEEIIRQIEANTARLKELEEDIQRKEQDNSGQNRELSAAYVRLGELILEDQAFASFTAPYQDQAGTLDAKVRSLEERLESFEDKNGTNVFAWIGKSAQTMVLRSFLSKTQDNLRRLCALAGENFFLTRLPDLEVGSLEETVQGEPAVLVQKIGNQRRLSADLSAELVRLRGERRKIGDNFGLEGSPVKQIQGQERHIHQIREDLRTLSLDFGKAAAGPRGQEDLAALLRPEDGTILERVAEIRGIIETIEGRIGKLRASLAIDEEKAEIGRLEKTILEYRERIAASERAITGLEGRISDSTRRIEELNLLLEGGD